MKSQEQWAARRRTNTERRLKAERIQLAQRRRRELARVCGRQQPAA